MLSATASLTFSGALVLVEEADIFLGFLWDSCEIGVSFIIHHMTGTGQEKKQTGDSRSVFIYNYSVKYSVFFI